MRRFRRFRDDRFALTTLQNPTIEVRTCAELVQAAQQERENQQAAAQIPATQEQAAPVAPATLTCDVPDSPDPLPAALAPEAPTLPEVEVERTNHPAPRPRRKTKSRPKSRSRRKSNRGTGNPACAPSATSTETEDPEQDDLSSRERHSRKCSICRHPERQSIDEAFLHWRSPETIMHCFGIVSETTIYDHAHVFNFFAVRNQNLLSALGNIIENIDTRHFSGSEMLDAVRVLAHLNDDGRWVHPTSKSEVIYSMQRPPAAQAALPAAQALLPAAQVAQPILISSRPVLENDAND